jgi:ferric-dicitrate binding protein FerR (iron transport regulator)
LEEPAKSLFHRWLSDKNLPREKDDALLSLWESTDSVVTQDTLTSLASLQIRHQSQSERKNVMLRIFRYAAVVALLALISSLLIYNTFKTVPETVFVEYYSSSEQTEQLRLPDGSIVRLNSGSMIMYPETYGKGTRTVYLTGEANFKVHKNKSAPFIVKSKNFSVTALGTEFDIAARPEDSYFRATLITGSVLVQQNNHPSGYILKPSEQFAYNAITKRYTVESVDLYDATSWQRGELVFDRATLVEVFDALERHYGVSFQYNSRIFNEDKYNFRFKKHVPISCIMDIIMEVTGDFTCKKTGDSYRIVRKNK